MAEEPIRDLFVLSLHQSGYSIFRFPRFSAQPQPPTDVESLRKIYNRVGDFNTSFQILRSQLEVVSVIPSEFVNQSMGEEANDEARDTIRNFFRQRINEFRGHDFAIFDSRILKLRHKIIEFPQLDFSSRTKLLIRVIQQHVNSISEPIVARAEDITPETRAALKAAQENKEIKKKGRGTAELRLNSYTRCIYREEE